MILVVFGTTGELIKLAPVLVRMRRRGLEYVLATTGQQVQQIPGFLRQFGLDAPDLWLARGAQGRDLRSNGDIPRWLRDVGRSFRQNRGWLRQALHRDTSSSLVLVHGDTMTTVLVSVMGRGLRVPVAHIEGGLRSHDLRNPFPEELNRRLATRLASIHYVPGSWAASNIDSGGEIVDTGSNTIRDSLALVPETEDIPVTVPEGPFGIVSLHRFELLNSRRRLRETLEALLEAGSRTPLLFVDHSVTVAAIARFGLGGCFDERRLVRIPRLRFFAFVQLLRRCSFAITDSGGSQEECYYLDLPCLVHRRKTERLEGLGENVVLSGCDVEVLRDFLDDPRRFRRAGPLPAASPSDVILADLERRRSFSEHPDGR
ncbi:MAG: UDP-N-acetylglucosamine 2-epimerase [Gaiellaceae bacterium]